MQRLELIEFCGEKAASGFLNRINIEQQIKYLQNERTELETELRESFSVDLSVTDILVASIAGILSGAMNGLFKTHIPEHGKFKHKHSTTRTAVDYKVPKPEGMKGSVQGLHRQLGPGHDLGRFKETLDLMSGKKKDFPLWGKTIAEQTGGILHPGNVKVADFIKVGGFKIPDNPAAELMNHLLIDFFTKTSLPLPFTSYLADSTPEMAKIMMGMYDNGLNLKTVVGNVANIAILHLVIHSYVYLFVSAKNVQLYDRLKTIKSAEEFASLYKELTSTHKKYLKTKEFNVLQAIAHGASFLTDTLITTASKNYAGLFCLDYGTLVLFTTDVLKYVKKGIETQNGVASKIENINEEILLQEKTWYDSFKKDILQLATKEGFFESFDPGLIVEKHLRIVNQLKEGNKQRDNFIKELQEWNIDETV